MASCGIMLHFNGSLYSGRPCPCEEEHEAARASDEERKGAESHSIVRLPNRRHPNEGPKPEPESTDPTDPRTPNSPEHEPPDPKAPLAYTLLFSHCPKPETTQIPDCS